MILYTPAVPFVWAFAQCYSSESIFIIHTKVKMLTRARLLRWWQPNARWCGSVDISQHIWKRITDSTPCSCGATIKVFCSAVETRLMSSPADQRSVVDAKPVAATAQDMMAEVESGVDALSTFPEGQQDQIFPLY